MSEIDQNCDSMRALCGLTACKQTLQRKQRLAAKNTIIFLVPVRVLVDWCAGDLGKNRAANSLIRNRAIVQFVLVAAARI